MSQLLDETMKIFALFVSRPEVIKMQQVVKVLESAESSIDSSVSVTARYRELLDQDLGLFNISPEYDLGVMRSGQDLIDFTCGVLKLRTIFALDKLRMILVNGDTTTILTESLAEYYHRIPVLYVIVGLGTGIRPLSLYPCISNDCHESRT